jgi:hypothetical protein
VLCVPHGCIGTFSELFRALRIPEQSLSALCEGGQVSQEGIGGGASAEIEESGEGVVEEDACRMKPRAKTRWSQKLITIVMVALLLICVVGLIFVYMISTFRLEPAG